LRAAFGEEVHALARNGLAEGKVARVEVGEELVEGARVDDRA
jgi:hypothetical protein